jgi:hypothetical protein
MTGLRRLITSADIDDRADDPAIVAIVARHELELMDGRRVLLLDDRGWGSSRTWGELSVENFRRTTLMVVGPDASVEPHSQEDMNNLHWRTLQEIAQRSGTSVSAAELHLLPHDIVLSARLLSRIARE